MKLMLNIGALLTLLALTSIHASAQSALQRAHAVRQSDPRQYIAFLEAAARTGSAEAQLELGEQYLEGLHAKVNEDKALTLIRAAADAGLPSAKSLLAQLYMGGIGEPRSLHEDPVTLLKASAERGDRAAIARLGSMYRYGAGVEIDYLEAARWHTLAANRGHSDLSPVLDSQGEPRLGLDPASERFAYFYSIYLKAIRGNDLKSMIKVGEALLEGSGGKPNPEHALIILNRAQALGSNEAAPLAVRAREMLSQASRAPAAPPGATPPRSDAPPLPSGEKRIFIK